MNKKWFAALMAAALLLMAGCFVSAADDTVADDTGIGGEGGVESTPSTAEQNGIVAEIKAMTKSGTIQASGLFDANTISAIKDALDDLANNNPNVLVTLDLSKVTGLSALPSRAFSECSNLISVTIPEGVTSIGTSAFNGCYNLKTVVIPSSVNRIWDFAFFGCASLTNATIPNGVDTIMAYTFSGCSSLTDIEIPSSVTSILQNAFEECSKLKTVTFVDASTVWYTTTSDQYDQSKDTNIGAMSAPEKNAETLKTADTRFYNANYS